MPSPRATPSRRAFLAALGSAGVAATAGCLSLSTPSAAGTWPRRSYDAANTGHAEIAGPTTDLHAVWHAQRPRGGGTTCSPVVGDGRLYLVYSEEAGTRDGPGGSWVEAFDAATGESVWTTELWRTDEFYYFYHSDSVVLDSATDRLYVQTHEGLKAVSTGGDADAGTVAWTFDNFGPTQPIPDAVPPIVRDDVVVTGSYETHENHGDERTEPEVLYGVDPTDGSELWRREFADATGMWQLGASDGTVYVPMLDGDGALVAVDSATGEERWRRPISADGTPAVADGTLFLPLRIDDGTRIGRQFVGAFDAETGEERWRVEVGPRWTDSCLAVSDGRLYYVADRSLVAREADTGERLWRAFGRNAREQVGLRTTPVVSGGVVYVNGRREPSGDEGGARGRLFALDAETGERLGTAKLGENQSATSAPAVTEELVFSHRNTGDLYAIGECEVSAAGRCLIG
ncbi:PQQ-binding-like beta-propeller repeat protein [Halopelagius longus]|uniref:Outer membrane protein assembly factor BamB n=1 Tax=Halopelagius longus TaxID=1236180 RepID=A0A1H1DT82_9EURY|nr:PQQ-binding-like beta-propeller repeat protein [Halopelagius longus]RDI71454.1 serine/threonine protein kinase [Halopelagius longus]SDQ79459.1 outer membrane protein assembly factor BamB [Halopelagius longus]